MRALARLYGIQPSYTSATGARVTAPADALARALSALGAPVSGPGDAAEALTARRAELRACLVEPVVVAWDGRVPSVPVRSRGRWLRAAVAPEGQEPASWITAEAGAEDADGRIAIDLRAGRLDPGYHTLHIDDGHGRTTALVMSAPRRAPSFGEPAWGVFAPAYAVRTEDDWGVGTFADLGRLRGWTAERGAEILATLPLSAAFLGEPFEASPYSPASRLFWNELYVDVRAAPELERSEVARAILGDRGFDVELRRLRAAELVDLRGVARAKRRVLEPLAETFFHDGPPPPAFERWLRGEPRVRDFARFRAEVDRTRATWPTWGERERDGSLPGAAEDDPLGRYHLYVQWLAHSQLEDLRRDGHRLYLDLPLGVNAGGYDVWRERRAFATDSSVGAPPDAFFSAGQDWGFPPLHPERIRKDGYAYPRACVAALAAYASAIRLDHVMGLHRLYWVPRGAGPSEGVYVRYRADEWYAMLSIEANRAGAIVVGEDLGTVPGYVRRAMRAHGFHTSYVVPFEIDPGSSTRPLRDPPPGSIASLGTHDMPPWAAFWSGSDVDLHSELGIIGEDEAARRRADRQAIRSALVRALLRRGLLRRGETGARAVLRGCLRFLASSDAAVVLPSLEDLWLEERPQNVPGTTGEGVANWRGRFRFTLEELRRDPDVGALLDEVASARRAAA